MVKRFYCDYCDASYPYSVEARKKHSQGHYHQKLKKLHYDHFKTAKERLEHELQKEKCRNFHSGRQCHYGESCIYSHLTAVDIEHLKMNVLVEEDQTRLAKLPTLQMKGAEPSTEEWTVRMNSKETETGLQPTELIEEYKSKYKLPSCLKENSDIPQSMIPPSLESLMTCSFQDWG
ncbi:zinc finger matrin-type protein 5-like [Macrobrachium rosenbergii]|uniref:zinc finger matrin-type protein 5-like n=1 Tax=Macrobrachium rosenbergii TaxID=79674 RepID=UPI0034D5CC9D